MTKELEATERQVEILSDELSKCSKALRLALEALEDNVIGKSGRMPKTHEAITAIREVLPQPEQEPVAFDPLPRACNLAGVDYQTFLKIKAHMPVTPPQRTWVELTDEEIWDLHIKMSVALNCKLSELIEFARATEAKLKEKNT